MAEDGARPGNYELGSLQSRAAARAMLARRFAGRKRLTIILDSEGDEPRLGDWREGADGTLVRRCYLSEGMTLQEAETIVSQPGWKPSIPVAKTDPIRRPLKPEW